MSTLDPTKLHVTNNLTTGDPRLPRRYTLTHSDSTGDLFLTIAGEYNRRQIAALYIRLMRDEVLAELTAGEAGPELHVYVHVSGGFAFGPAGWRNEILHYHMPMVLQALRHGDRELYARQPELDHARVQVHFAARQRRYRADEAWGEIGQYALAP